MEAVIEFFGSLTNDSTTVRFMVIGLAAVTVAILGLGISNLFLNATDPVRRRLGEVGESSGVDRVKDGRVVTFNTFAGPISKFVVPRGSIDQSETVRKLVYADVYSANAVQNYFAIRAVLIVLLPAIVVMASSWMPSLSSNAVMLYAACAAGVGYVGPSYVLDRMVANRQKALRVGFPDALDLMVVCIESGLGLGQTIDRVADELMVSHPELAEELALVNAEMRAGVESVTALKNLADRTGLEDIRGLVSTLVQTLRFGTSVADGLRVYSEEFRDKRMQNAEERAAKIGTKMIFPLVFFMFPAFFVVAVGPAVVQMIDAFSKL